MNQDNPRLSPRIDSALDRSSDPIPGTMWIDPALASRSSAHPSDRLRIEIPSLRDESITPPPMPQASKGKARKKKKVSAKGTLTHVAAKKKTKVVKQMLSKGGLWFSLPRLLIAYVEERMIAISQLTAPCIRNLVTAIVAARDLGFEMTPRFVNEITHINKNHSLLGTWLICWRKGLKLTSDTSVKFACWWHKFFFVKVNSASVLDVDRVYRTKWSPFVGSFLSLLRHDQEDVHAMLNINEIPSFFDDELNAEADATAEAEEKAADLEANPSPLSASPVVQESSTPSRAKRAREPTEGGSKVIPEAKRTRTENPPIEAGVRTEDLVDRLLEDQVILEEMRTEEKAAAGPRAEETGRGSLFLWASVCQGRRVWLPVERGDEHGFEFLYDGLVMFLNHAEASAGFQQTLYAALQGEEPPNGLMFSEDIAQIAKMEQRVDYRRIQLIFAYEKLLISAAGERDLAKNRLDAVEKDKTSIEKERDAALAKIKDLEKDFSKAKKEKRAKRLKEQPVKVELENVELKKKLEIEVESSKVRDSALELSRTAEETISGELATLREHYDDLYVHNADEIAWLRCSRSERVKAT
ncbi:unnamed protein product [Cochlearia groenlandica]